MTETSLIEALAWRQLRCCRNYEPGPVDPGMRSRIVSRPGGTDDGILGLYVNAPDEVIAVGEMAMYYRGKDGRMTIIPYADVVDVKGPAREDAAPLLRIRLRDGSEIDLPVRGSEGGFQDVWPFLRFFAVLVCGGEPV